MRVVLDRRASVGEAAEFAPGNRPCEDLMVTAGGTAIATASDERILQSWDMRNRRKGRGGCRSRPVRVMIYVGSKSTSMNIPTAILS